MLHMFGTHRGFSRSVAPKAIVDDESDPITEQEGRLRSGMEFVPS